MRVNVSVAVAALAPMMFVPVAFPQGNNPFSVSTQQMLTGVDAATVQKLVAQSNAIQRNPNDVTALVTRATISLNIADHSPYSFQWIHFAAKDLEKAIRLAPNNFYARHNYAMACFQAGDVGAAQPNMQLAVIQFGKAIQLKPDSARSFMGRGWAYLMLNNETHADVDFQKALQLEPDLRPQLLKEANAIRQKKACAAAMQRHQLCAPSSDYVNNRYNPRLNGSVVR